MGQSMTLDGSLVHMTKSALWLIDELRKGASETQRMVLDNRADYLRRFTVAALCDERSRHGTGN